jgi:hypothetical protein
MDGPQRLASARLARGDWNGSSRAGRARQD